MMGEPSAPLALRRLDVQPLGIDLWLVQLDSLPDDDCDVLSAQEYERAARFVFDRDRRRFLAAHRALRRVLAKFGTRAPGEPFQFSFHGKPYLPPPCACSFNLSHSGNWALIGVCEDAAIGVDIELMRNIDEIELLAQQHFTAGELNELAALKGEDAQRAFLSGWTRKEACLKALGCGLNLTTTGFEAGLAPLPRALAITLDGTSMDLELHSVQLGVGLLASVARVASQSRTTFLER